LYRVRGRTGESDHQSRRPNRIRMVQVGLPPGHSADHAFHKSAQVLS
jgi:hypothetical protein